MIRADDLASPDWPQTRVPDGLGETWVKAKPTLGPLRWRIRDAWRVLLGKAEAVFFTTHVDATPRHPNCRCVTDDAGVDKKRHVRGYNAWQMGYSAGRQDMNPLPPPQWDEKSQRAWLRGWKRGNLEMQRK